MTSKISKSVLPRFLASRKDIIRRSYVLDAGQGPPILAATYENISSISLVDSDTLQAETITGKVQGEIATLRSADGYIAFSQGSNLTIVFLGNGKQKTLSIGPKFWFFFDTNYLVVVGGDDVTKLRLEPQLATGTIFSLKIAKSHMFPYVNVEIYSFYAHSGDPGPTLFFWVFFFRVAASVRCHAILHV